MIRMRQVHGNNVVKVDHNDNGKVINNCDSLISNDPKVTLCVRVADCLPISITDKKRNAIGIIHAGWRGLDKNIIEKTIHLMTDEFSSEPEDLEVTIGPHICQKHYEVQNDVSSKFTKYAQVVFKKDEKEYLNLAKIAEAQLKSLGVKKQKIVIDGRCTFEDKSLPSYRRDGSTNHLDVYNILT